jgi:hypothetical protein
MRPKFQVGEEVILQSKARPECNGECIVTEVTTGNIKPEDGAPTYRGVAYFTSIEHPEGYKWAESALKKKHDPGTKSFSQLISDINKVKLRG